MPGCVKGGWVNCWLASRLLCGLVLFACMESIQCPAACHVHCLQCSVLFHYAGVQAQRVSTVGTTTQGRLVGQTAHSAKATHLVICGPSIVAQ